MLDFSETDYSEDGIRHCWKIGHYIEIRQSFLPLFISVDCRDCGKFYNYLGESYIGITSVSETE